MMTSRESDHQLLLHKIWVKKSIRFDGVIVATERQYDMFGKGDSSRCLTKK